MTFIVEDNGLEEGFLVIWAYPNQDPFLIEIGDKEMKEKKVND